MKSTESYNVHPPKCYSVTEITALIREMLEAEFFKITIEGEISNFRPSSTGHYYFNLKDKEAIISAVMFRNRQNALTFELEDGQKVKASGNLSVYARRGNYQLICENLVKSGEGELLADLEKLKARLANLGYFDGERKRPIPLFPGRVAVITSPTGAAIRDILRVLKQRNAGLNLIILPAPVQGDGAPEIIARQIRTANIFNLADVLIVSRGGGSLEDLLPFYDEQLVRAIVDSRIPVISAVGHEIDFTFSDLAADLRAPTPSAAAENVSASSVELLRRIQEHKSSIVEATLNRLEKIRLLIGPFSPENLKAGFDAFLQPFLLDLDNAREGLISCMESLLVQIRHRCELLARDLGARSPLDVLKRGYAVVIHEKTQRALDNVDFVKVNDGVDIRLYRGKLKAIVTEKRE